MLTVQHLMDFILRNKTNKVFLNQTEIEIASQVSEALSTNSLYYAVDKDNNITGMILAKPDEQQKILFVTENLSMSLSTLKQFAQKAKEQFVGYKIEAMRHGKHRKFDTTKLYTKLS